MILPHNTVEIPATDILTWTFQHCLTEDNGCRQKVWIDCYDTSKSIDAVEARGLVRKLISGLRQHGVQPGDVVCVHSFNSIWYPAILLAIIGAGAIFVGSNPAYKPAELEHLFTTSRAKHLIVEQSLADNVLPTAIKVGICVDNVFVLDTETNTSNANRTKSSGQDVSCSPWTELLKHGESDWTSFDDTYLSQSTPAVYLSSSGTTGLPKIVVMSHAAIVAQLAYADYQVGRVAHQVRRLITLPFFHSFALPFPILSLHRQEPLFIMPRFSASDCTSFIESYKITMIPVVPPMAKALFGSPEVHRFDSLTEIISAGAPMDATTQQNLFMNLPSSTRLVQLWGMSETGWLTTFRYPEGDLTGSVGRLLPGVKAKLYDADGNEVVDESRTGETWVRTPGLMMGYLDRPDANAEAMKNGWLRTGDVACQKAGKWYIVDRAKDMIKVRGWQVSPVEVESSILQHLGVKDAAVVGVPDEISGEKPLAFVVPRDSAADMTELVGSIQNHIAKTLASYKALAGGVVLVEQIPRGPSGKILRRLLRDQLLDRI